MLSVRAVGVRKLFTHSFRFYCANPSSHDYDYDICVIGGGPSGYAAAVRGSDFGKKVCLVEKNLLGGTGVYNGAMSSKV